MKAIITKYYGPTNTRGSRFKATDEDGNQVTVSYDYSLNSESNHVAACLALCAKMNWHGEIVHGALGNQYVHVFTAKHLMVVA